MSARRGRRERLVLRLPAALIEFPFECLVALYGTLSAASVLAGGAIPPALRETLPAPVIAAWATMLLLGALTTGLGIILKFRLALPIGLRTFAIALFIYIGAIFSTGAYASLPGAFLLAAFASLAALRSLYLRTSVDVRARLRSERSAVENGSDHRPR